MKRYKILLITLLFILGVSYCTTPKDTIYENYQTEMTYINKFSEGKSRYNKDYVILVDFSIHSGKNRFFIVDKRTGKIINKSLVAHGKGKGRQSARPKQFSNQKNSRCSSLGIGEVYYRNVSTRGLKFKYWVDGISHSNSNMRKRLVVIHSSNGVKDHEIYPKTTPTSHGCFTVSNNFLKEFDVFVKENRKNGIILLYAFK